MTDDWFERLMGFQELPYQETKRHLEVVGKTLRSRINGWSYSIGDLETPSLGELRDRASTLISGSAGKVRVSNIIGDVGEMHRDPENRHAMFQVASQFNLLEMTGPDVSPEDGVTRYFSDRTQGPACAIAAGAGPRTPAGLERSRRARWLHGGYSQATRAVLAEGRRQRRALWSLLGR